MSVIGMGPTCGASITALIALFAEVCNVLIWEMVRCGSYTQVCLHAKLLWPTHDIVVSVDLLTFIII